MCFVKQPDLIHIRRHAFDLHLNLQIEIISPFKIEIVIPFQAHWWTLISVTGAEAATNDFHSVSFQSAGRAFIQPLKPG